MDTDPKTKPPVRPMLVVFSGAKQLPGPSGETLEVVEFKVWEPDSWEGEWWLTEGSHMAGTRFDGLSEPVVLVSKPIVVKAPPPRIIRGGRMPDPPRA